MRNQRSPYGIITSLIVSALAIVLFMYLGMKIARGVFRLLSWLAPVLIVITLIIDYRVVTNYGKWLVNLLRNQTLYGVLACIGTIFLFPFVAGWLFFRAILRRRIKKVIGNRPSAKIDEYVDYEEVDSEIHQKQKLRDSYRQ